MDWVRAGERGSCLELLGFWYEYLEVPFSDIENTEKTRFSGAKIKSLKNKDVVSRVELCLPMHPAPLKKYAVVLQYLRM